MEQENKGVNIYTLLDSKVKPVIYRLRKFWFIPLVLAFVGVLTGYFIEKSKPTVYTTTISYMLEDDILNEKGSVSPSGQLLAALAGQSPSSNKLVMVDLGLSNKLIEQTLLRTVDIDGKNVQLIDYYIEKFGFSGNFKTKDPFVKNYVIGSDKQLDYWLRSFSSNIKLTLTSKQKESGIFIMEFNSRDELFTKLFLENHLNTISDFYINKKIERSQLLVNIAKRKRDSLLMTLQGKTYSAAKVSDDLFGAVKKTAHVAEVQLNRDMAILNSQYAESVVAFNAASLDLERRKPFIAVVDDIRLPLLSTGPKPMKSATVFGIAGLIVGIVILVGWIFGMDYLRTQKSEFENSRNQEL